MKSVELLLVAIVHLVAFSVGAAAFYLFRFASPGFALILGACCGAPVAGLLYHRRAPERAPASVKLWVGVVLSFMAVLTGFTSQLLLGWMTRPDVVVPVAVVGSFAFAWALFGPMQRACEGLPMREMRGKAARREPVVQHFEVELFADYHQFYVWDAGAEPQAPEDYTDDDVRKMVKVGEHVVVVQPVRAMTVPVELEVHPSEPGRDPSIWDHVVETAIDLPTGKLQVHECTGGPVLDVDVKPGTYQVATLFAGLGTISPDGLDGDDLYKVVLWPGELRPLRVVRQWLDGRDA